MGRRSSEPDGRSIFRQADGCALQALRRTRRGHALRDAGKESHAVLPRGPRLSNRIGRHGAEVTAWFAALAPVNCVSAKLVFQRRRANWVFDLERAGW